MFVKLFTTQLNKLVWKDFVLILSATIKSFIIRHDHVSWSSSRLTAEIQRFLLSVVVSSNSSPWFLTNDGIRKNGWVFSSHFSSSNQQRCKQPYLHLFELVLITFEGNQHGGYQPLSSGGSHGWKPRIDDLPSHYSASVSRLARVSLVTKLEDVTLIHKVVQFSSVQWAVWFFPATN